MDRFNQRQGFLLSAIAHLLIMMLLVSRPPSAPRASPEATEPSKERRTAVFLPPPAVLRQLIPRPPGSPAPAATPPPVDRPKDRISIGPPATERAKGPLVLRREDDLTAIPKGRPNAVPTPADHAPPERAEAQQGGAPETPSAEGLRLPPGGAQPSGQEGSRGRPGSPGPSIASSLRRLEERLAEAGPQGAVTGTGQQVGPLFFDPQGADFTRWINQFKNEVYRNWILPQPARFGMAGHVDIEIVVERDGSLSGVQVLKSAGTAALDRAAVNALKASELLPLPADFGPPRVTMQVSFYYNEEPRG